MALSRPWRVFWIVVAALVALMVVGYIGTFAGATSFHVGKPQPTGLSN